MQLAPCAIDQMLGGSALARCGSLAVPENRDDPASRTISLRITVIPSLRLQPEADPLVIISGGPGQSASDFYVTAGAAFGAIRRDRDILVVDQRGTGGSQRLDCQFNNDADLITLQPDDLKRLGEGCLSKLPGDPRFYTTSVAVRDLDDVRAALGYEQVSLYGVSYGTRVAQHYLRRYPQRVRSMILDGVVPVDLALGPDIPLRAQQALDSIFTRCASDAACNKAFPDVRDEFQALREHLAREPVSARLPDPVTAQLADSKFGSMHMNAAIRLLTYSDETASLLPLLIHQAGGSQQFDSFIAQYLMIEQKMSTQFAYGMHFAVVCSEDARRWDQENIPADKVAASYLGGTFMESMRAMCEIWPRGTVDENFNAPLRSDTPTLILSGGNDPVTPAEYGERAIRSYPRGRHIVLDGQGHGQLATACMPRLLGEFVRTADAAKLDIECLKGVKPAPFMLSPAGPGP